MGIIYSPTKVLRGISSYRTTASGDILKRTTSLPSVQLFMACGWAVRDVDTNNASSIFVFRVSEAPGQAHANLTTDAGGDNLIVHSAGASANFYAITTGKPFFWALTGDTSNCFGYACTLGESTFSSVGEAVNAHTPVIMAFGDRYTGGGEFWNGRLWGVRVWNATLTADELKQEMFNGGAPVRQLDLHGWWPMEGNHDQITRDYSGNNRHLTRAGVGSPEKFFLPERILPRQSQRRWAPAGAGLSANPGLGALTLTGYAPTAIVPERISSGLGALTLTGIAPTVTQQLKVSSGLGALSLTGLAPTVTQQVRVSSGLGALTLTGLAPTVTQQLNVSTGLGALVLEGFAPQVNDSPNISTGRGQLTVSGLAPTISATDHKSVATNLGQLTLSGFAPSLNLGIQSGFGALVINGLAPSVQTDTGITVPIGLAELILNGFEPIVSGGEAMARITGAGKSRKRRRKIEVEIDGEVFDVNSEEEAVTLFDTLKAEARKQADLAIQRAQKAEKRPTRKVLADVRKSLAVPYIKADALVMDLANEAMLDIENMYQDALRIVEIGALLKKRDDDDDEEAAILLLL